jgi:hypothetical protein
VSDRHTRILHAAQRVQRVVGVIMIALILAVGFNLIVPSPKVTAIVALWAWWQAMSIKIELAGVVQALTVGMAGEKDGSR